MANLLTRLLDRFSQPVQKAELVREIAGPTISGVRPVISGHPAEGLTPKRLALIHRDAAEGDPLLYLELAEDIEERDLHYLSVLSTRKRSVSQLPITVKAASDAADHVKHAAYVQSWIDDEILAAAIFDMLDAVGKGFSICEIDWQLHLGHLCPREFVWRPQRWFDFSRLDGETIKLRGEVGDDVLPPHKFVMHRHKAKSGLTIRSGIARVASWAWMYKSFTQKDWAIFAQNFGMPIRVGKYDRNATEKEKDVLWRAVASIAGDTAAIIPADMLVEFHEVGAKSGSTDLYERRADWLDRQVSKAVLGQTTTTDAVAGGHAVSQEHRLVQEDIERADALGLSRTINAQVIANMVAFEFGPQDHYPKILIGRPDEVPIGEFATAFDKLGQQGLTAGLAWTRNRLGIPEPDDDEELIGGKPAAPAISGDNPDAAVAADDGSDTKFSKNSSIAQLTTSRHAAGKEDETIAALTERLEKDARGALAGLSDQVRDVLEHSSDLKDAAEKLARMNLPPDALAEAMARGMALAHLAGQAALIDDLARRK